MTGAATFSLRFLSPFSLMASIQYAMGSLLSYGFLFYFDRNGSHYYAKSTRHDQTGETIKRMEKYKKET